jgi:two-component system LytT family sensor kinase
MQPRVFSGRAKTAAAIVGLWSAYAINETIHSYYEFQIYGKPLAWSRAAFGEFSFAYICAALTPLVLWLGNKFRVARPHLWRNLVVHAMAAVIFMSVVRLAWDIIYVPPKPFYDGGATLKKVIYAISGTYESTFPAYLLILLAGYVWEYQRRYRQEAVRAARLRTEMVQAQLQSLKMQIQPHFLFNTLHTISALVQESPPAAERTIARLSDLLRLTLEKGRNSEIQLDDELKMIGLYLEIECTRYEERLAVQFSVDEETRTAIVPSFILQPLIENAIHHGIANSTGPGHIIVAAQRRDAHLFLAVRNTGPGLPRTFREGVGLGATRSRLEFLYGDRYQFVLRGLTSGEVEASIVIPFATEESRRGEHGEHSNADRGRREAGTRAAETTLSPRA